MLVFIVYANLVVEDGVKTHEFEIRGLLDCAKISAITVAQREDRPAGAEHLFPIVREAVVRGRGIDDELLVTPSDQGSEASEHEDESGFHERTSDIPLTGSGGAV